MPLRRRHVEGFAHQIVKALSSTPGLTCREAPTLLTERIVAVIEADLAKEHALDDEADRLLQQQLRAAGSKAKAELDLERARLLIKKELAKKRGIVL
ncbi:MAG: DUF507 family protein [Deltaproteobacteria bacterium]|nr:DUF507 family protein [Deltaproteobacteria bacterium]